MKLIGFLLLSLTMGVAQAQQAPSADAPPASNGMAAVTDNGPADAVREIRKVAADYNAAMARKDSSALLDFYFDGNVPVIGSVAPASYALMFSASKGKAPKVFSSPAKQAVQGDTNPKATVEKVSNLSVQTDGAIATVQYDYAIPQGHGHTFWTLVHTTDAWKITSIVYSINLASLDKK
ncbi:hypothetical protein [Dyella silvatica]|uniref:hypothetical protein n=1 Tax=Dyella silvatica TaxID=2992128 RepID=UPI0022587D68|nr:hypothetical protein [Dyella silvatica]